MRKLQIVRNTKETKVMLELNLDRPGAVNVKTSVPFMDHMLTLFAHHGNFSLKINAKGDTEVDNHHLVEDLGISLGLALEKALGGKKGINRYGSMLLPMDEALSYVSMDISGRPLLEYKLKFKNKANGFDYDLIEDFFAAFVNNARVTLHISMKAGRNDHHIAESVFKGFGRALAQAVRVDKNRKGVPSSKGMI
jgi:imidazoleglycerol-phosphate dehydratase